MTGREALLIVGEELEKAQKEELAALEPVLLAVEEFDDIQDPSPQQKRDGVEARHGLTESINFSRGLQHLAVRVMERFSGM